MKSCLFVEEFTCFLGFLRNKRYSGHSILNIVKVFLVSTLKCLIITLKLVFVVNPVAQPDVQVNVLFKRLTKQMRLSHVLSLI